MEMRFSWRRFSKSANLHFNRNFALIGKKSQKNAKISVFLYSKAQKLAIFANIVVEKYAEEEPKMCFSSLITKVNGQEEKKARIFYSRLESASKVNSYHRKIKKTEH